MKLNVLMLNVFSALTSLTLAVSCEKGTKTVIESNSLESRLENDESKVSDDKTAAFLSDQGIGGGDGGSGTDGGTQGDDPIPTFDPFELEDWNIRSFTDPRTNETYDIIDARVIIAFTNPPVLPVVEPNYFDSEIPPNDPYYGQFVVPGVGTDPAIQAFIAAENLTVYSEWNTVNGIGALLPPGQTVEDAVANWPTQYAGLVEAVDPDRIVNTDAWPQDDPNDDGFLYQWNLDEDDYYDYDINIQHAWIRGYLGFGQEVVAVLDTGVQFIHDDLTDRRTAHGINTGDKLSSTRYWLNGGEPYDWLLRWNPYCAYNLGHGTSVAGIIAASINNDPDTSPNETDACGITRYNRYLPIAMKAFYYGYSSSDGGYSLSAVLNAYEAIGKVKRIFAANSSVPYYNVEVVNCSFSYSTVNPSFSFVESRYINSLSPYMVFVCSAGNNDSDTVFAYPAAYANCMAVAAHDHDGYRTSSSNWNSNYLDIAAPGISILTTDMVGYTSNNYQLGFTSGSIDNTFRGTSAAAPHVSAVAVMLSSRFRDLTPAQIRTRLINTANHDLNGSIEYLGRIDAFEALD